MAKVFGTTGTGAGTGKSIGGSFGSGSAIEGAGSDGADTCCAKAGAKGVAAGGGVLTPGSRRRDSARALISSASIQETCIALIGFTFQDKTRTLFKLGGELIKEDGFGRRILFQ